MSLAQALAAPEFAQLVEATGDDHSLPSLNPQCLLRLAQMAHEWGGSEDLRRAEAAKLDPAVIEAARERLTSQLRQKEQMSAFASKLRGRLRDEVDVERDTDSDEGWCD